MEENVNNFIVRRRFMVCEVQASTSGIGAFYWDTTDQETISILCLLPVEAIASLEHICFKDSVSDSLVYIYDADTYIVRYIDLDNGNKAYRLIRKDEQP